ncbi:MAG TPA: hypothetical protein VFB55_01410 [Verrucomicrobiae bacterium]|nr:hypothetical protein [Verrucomicrobiae bacterium]
MNQHSIPRLPQRRELLWQMAIQPPAGTCFISLTNVVVIASTAYIKLHFATFVKFLFQLLFQSVKG